MRPSAQRPPRHVVRAPHIAENIVLFVELMKPGSIIKVLIHVSSQTKECEVESVSVMPRSSSRARSNPAWLC